jgi:hypothetical protein
LAIKISSELDNKVLHDRVIREPSEGRKINKNIVKNSWGRAK